jgi:hypothetical protein
MRDVVRKMCTLWKWTGITATFLLCFSAARVTRAYIVHVLVAADYRGVRSIANGVVVE